MRQTAATRSNQETTRAARKAPRTEPRQGFDAGRTIRLGDPKFRYTADLYRLSQDGDRVIDELVEQFGPGAVLIRLKAVLVNLVHEAEQQDHPKADLFRQLQHIVGQAYQDVTTTTTSIYEGKE